MNKPDTYTLEELERRQVQLKKRIRQKEADIKQEIDDLFLAPTVENQFDQIVNYAKVGFNIYDGFRTGFKLLRSFGFSFRKKNK